MIVYAVLVKTPESFNPVWRTAEPADTSWQPAIFASEAGVNKFLADMKRLNPSTEYVLRVAEVQP